MPLDYLRSIAQSAFPLEVTDPHGLRCIHVLVAAQLVEATISEDEQPGSGETAVVHSITHEGRAVLERDAGNKPIA